MRLRAFRGAPRGRCAAPGRSPPSPSTRRTPPAQRQVFLVHSVTAPVRPGHEQVAALRTCTAGACAHNRSYPARAAAMHTASQSALAACAARQEPAQPERTAWQPRLPGLDGKCCTTCAPAAARACWRRAPRRARPGCRAGSARSCSRQPSGRPPPGSPARAPRASARPRPAAAGGPPRVLRASPAAASGRLRPRLPPWLHPAAAGGPQRVGAAAHGRVCQALRRAYGRC